MAKSLKELMNKARGGSHEAALEAARHEKAVALQLEELSHSPFAEARKAVALHPATGLDTLARLGYDFDLEVSATVAGRENLPHKVLENLLIRAAAEFASKRGHDKAMLLDMIAALCDNAGVPLARINELLAKLPGSQLPRFLAERVARPELLTGYTRHPKATVRLACLANPALNDELLVELCSDANDRVRAEANHILEEHRGDLADNLRQEYRSIKEFQAGLIAENYEAELALRLGGKEKVEELRNHFLASAPQSGDVLHLGSADGWLAVPLAKSSAGRSVTACDVSPLMLEQVQRKGAGLANLKTVLANLSQEKEFPQGAFDHISADGIFLHLENKGELFRSCLAALKTGGSFAGWLPCLADDNDDSAIFAEAASAFGFFPVHKDEMSMYAATSGLVIESFGEFAPFPAFTDPAVAKAMKQEHWRELLADAVADGCNLKNVTIGAFKVFGRKVEIR